MHLHWHGKNFRSTAALVDFNAVVLRQKREQWPVAAPEFVQRYAEERVPAQDRARLMEVIETQLLNLHDGSTARYRLRPGQYQAWTDVWK